MKAANEALSIEKPSAVTFDTLAAAQELRKSGLEDRQAEAIVATISKAMNETVATKADLELQGLSIKSEIAATKMDLEIQITETRTEIAATKMDLELQITETRTEIAATKMDLEIQITETRTEIAATKADLELQGAATRAEIVATRRDLEEQINKLKAAFELQTAEIAALKQSMASLQDKIVIRLGALMVTMTFLLLAIGPFYIRWVMSLMAPQ